MDIPGCYNPAQPKIVRRFHAIEHVTKTHWRMCKKPKVWLNFVANRLGLIKNVLQKKLVAQIRWYGQGISLHISWGRWIIFGVESATWHVCSFWLKHWKWPTKNPDVYRSLRLQCGHERVCLEGLKLKLENDFGRNENVSHNDDSFRASKKHQWSAGSKLSAFVSTLFYNCGW